MPWEITIRKQDGGPIGNRDEVIQRISAAVPSMQWWEEPSMLDRIKTMPDHPFHALIPTWPEATRANFSIAHLNAELSENDLSIRLYGFESDPITSVHAEVRGNGDPTPMIA